MAALRQEAHGLVAITYYAAALGGDVEAARCRVRLVEIVEALGFEEPPPWRELVERPALIDEWAERFGLSVWR